MNWIEFARLAGRRFCSDADYIAFQMVQAHELVAYLQRWPGLNLARCRALDLGSSYGGYTRVLAGAGADIVALDHGLPAGADGEGLPGKMVVGDAAHTPFADAAFDLVVCSSLIEHVPSAEAVIAEIVRLLPPGGWCYLSFPPYWSPRGGHNFSPFHWLGERAALRVYNWRHRETPVTSMSTAYGEYGLHKRTIAGMRRLLRGYPLELMDLSARWMWLNPARVPLLGEVLTWHVQFLLRRHA